MFEPFPFRTDRQSGGKRFLAGVGEGEQPGAAIGRRGFDVHQPAPLERLQCRSQRGAIHRQQLGDRAHRRRFRTVQRHQQRELLIGEADRPQRFVEMSRQGPRCALGVKAQAGVANQQCRLEWDRP